MILQKSLKVLFLHVTQSIMIQLTTHTGIMNIIQVYATHISSEV